MPKPTVADILNLKPQPAIIVQCDCGTLYDEDCIPPLQRKHLEYNLSQLTPPKCLNCGSTKKWKIKWESNGEVITEIKSGPVERL